MTKRSTPKSFEEGPYRTAADAIKRHDIDALRRTLPQIEDVDRFGPGETNLLWYAMSQDNTEAISLLVESGANVSMSAPVPGGAGIYPLRLALANTDPKLLIAMLDGGLPLDYVSPHETTLLITAVRNGPHHVPLLVERGADVNQSTRHGDTPLFNTLTAFGDGPDLARYLIRQGADVNAQRASGVTPGWIVADFIERSNNPTTRAQWERVRDLLIEHGAEWPPRSREEVRAWRREQGLPTMEEPEKSRQRPTTPSADREQGNN